MSNVVVAELTAATAALVLPARRVDSAQSRNAAALSDDPAGADGGKCSALRLVHTTGTRDEGAHDLDNPGDHELQVFPAGAVVLDLTGIIAGYLDLTAVRTDLDRRRRARSTLLHIDVTAGV